MFDTKTLLATAGAIGLTAGMVQAQQVFNSNVTIDGSLCVGVDCVSNESYGFDTIRLKENNLRIKAQDTSTSASFPTQDWQITFNDSSNGGQNKFSIDAITPIARTPFTIEDTARSNSIYVDGSRVGFGTTTPAVTLHARDGNTPTLRLEQDGSSGFTPQTWDVAGNEANFFVRDATNGSTLPFKVFPGAPSNALTIRGTGATAGNIGMGTTTPEEGLHVKDGNILVEQAGPVNVTLRDTDDPSADVRLQHALGELRMSFVASGVIESVLTADGDYTVHRNITSTTGDIITTAGNFIAGAQTLIVPDYVFEDDYELRPLAEVRAFIDENSHLPEVPSAAAINAGGLNITEMQMTLLKKIEELTLYTLDQEERMAQMAEELEQLRRE